MLTRFMGTGTTVALGLVLPALGAHAQTAATAPAPVATAPPATVAATVPAPAPASAAPENEAPKKGWSVTAGAQYRELAVIDDMNRNDSIVLWSFGGSVEAFKGGRVSIRTGLSERFVAQPEESGWLLRDTAIGLGYATPLELGSKTLELNHKVQVFLPTSRASLAQDLYCAPQYVLAASMEVVHGLSVSFSPDVRYRWHKFAERDSQVGEMNVRWEIDAGGGLDWTFLESDTFGSLTIGASASSGWQKYYTANDTRPSKASDPAAWAQGYGWEAHLGYDPLKYLSLGASLEQGGSVLRDGIVNVFFAHRDETEMAFTVTGTY